MCINECHISGKYTSWKFRKSHYLLLGLLRWSMNGLLGCRTRTTYISMLKNCDSPIESLIDKRLQFLIAPWEVLYIDLHSQNPLNYLSKLRKWNECSFVISSTVPFTLSQSPHFHEQQSTITSLTFLLTCIVTEIACWSTFEQWGTCLRPHRGRIS